MPPKPKFTKEEIVQAALNVVSEKGVEALTAKELGTALGSSARPIFTVFNSMKEVRDEVRIAAMQRFESFAEPLLPDRQLSKVGRSSLSFELPLGFKEAEAYRKANGQYLRKNQWRDTTVRVLIDLD